MLKTTTSIINASQIATPITFAGNVTLSTGNLVIGTAGKGIDFSATTSGSGTMTSELLSDYEEGTFTPIDLSAASLTFTTASGTYTKIGNTVTLTMSVLYPSTANLDLANIGGFPFTAASIPGSGGAITYTDSSLALTLYQTGLGLRLYTTAGTSVQNVSVSTKYVEAIIIYRV